MKGKGKYKAPVEGYGKSTEQQGGKGSQNGAQGQEDPDDFASATIAEKKATAMHCGNPRAKGKGKRGVYIVDDEAIEETEPQDVGALDLCAVELVVETSVGQINAITHDVDLSAAETVVETGARQSIAGIGAMAGRDGEGCTPKHHQHPPHYNRTLSALALKTSARGRSMN